MITNVNFRVPEPGGGLLGAQLVDEPTAVVVETTVELCVGATTVVVLCAVVEATVELCVGAATMVVLCVVAAGVETTESVATVPLTANAGRHWE